MKMQTVDNLFYGGVEPRASLSQPSYYAVHTSLGVRENGLLFASDNGHG